MEKGEGGSKARLWNWTSDSGPVGDVSRSTKVNQGLVLSSVFGWDEMPSRF